MADSIRDFFDMATKFEVRRDDETRFELLGIRERAKREIRFEPDVDVQEGDIVIALDSGNRFIVTEVDMQPGFEGRPYALIVTYQTEADRRSAEREPHPTQQFNFHAPAYGMFGSQQHFNKFEQVIQDLEGQIEERGGDDKEALREMVQEIQETLESQDSISRGKFERWSELANKHAPWLLGPLGSLFINYSFGVLGGAG